MGSVLISINNISLKFELEARLEAGDGSVEYARDRAAK